MTKLIIRTIQTPTGPKVMLCDEQGAALPMQRETVVTCGIEQIDTITVTFAIDGDRITLEPSA
ncbi:hypothetical protein [Brevundimonas bullata]|uniref:hypothetical protein n=1 Tax=Brevundimonas bullata TaxID=13160 RepID=UPI003D9A257D